MKRTPGWIEAFPSSLHSLTWNTMLDHTTNIKIYLNGHLKCYLDVDLISDFSFDLSSVSSEQSHISLQLLFKYAIEINEFGQLYADTG